LFEGVVISPRLGLAYLMRPNGGIQAVDLASGAVRWRSDRAAKPLALAGDRLIAQAESRRAGTLHLAVLDARSGADRHPLTISLPKGIVATVVDSPSGSFRVQADSAGSDLVVRWEASGLAAGAQGYLPADGVEQEVAGAVVAGSAVIDLASPAPRVKAEPQVRVARSAALAKAALEELQAPVVKGVEGRQMLSADGRHVLVTEPAGMADVTTMYRHRWTVYERASGARLGSVPAMVSATPFLVVGKTLYHTTPFHAALQKGKLVESPFSLRAVHLVTGAEAWTKAVGETEFRGPFPP
jgi:hypothetical protein